MINFKELKPIITSACKSERDENINDRFKFTINADKLEKNLSAKTNLHVMMFNHSVTSRVPSIEDIQFLSEYNHKNDDLNFESIMDGSTQFVAFMLYCDTTNGKEKITFEGKPLEYKEVFDALNDKAKLNKKLAVQINNKLPIYRVLITRRFNSDRDKFEYSVFFRSNYKMVSYVKSLKDTNNLEDNTEE